MLHRDLLPDRLLQAEIAQRRSEGYDLGELPNRVEAAIVTGTIQARADAFWAELDALPSPPTGREEPSDLEAIRAARPDGPRRYAMDLNDAPPPSKGHSDGTPLPSKGHSDGTPPPSKGHSDGTAFYDRVYGAWLGRCAGCTLGKPVEGWARAKIEAYLRAADAYPLSSYFPVIRPFPEGLALWSNYERTALGNVRCMTRDDDIDYTVLGLHILETYGRHFSNQDVALAWIDNLPFHKVYTAEAAAYRNLVNGLELPQVACHQNGPLKGVGCHQNGPLKGVACHHNPYREWIGAQIRADMWGYVNPGNPERAADFAYRDAALSHTANGIYGAMWAAACIAAAFATDEPRQVITTGLAEIPADCRLAEAVRDTMAWAGECPAWEETWERVNSRYGGYPTVHVINNTCMIVLGLLYGEGDLERSICPTVMGGWDTDCTGATVGSIVGAMCGASTLPEEWVAPLNDRLESIIAGFQDSRISDLARRTVALADMSEEIEDSSS